MPDPSASISSPNATGASTSDASMFGFSVPDLASNIGNYYSAQSANAITQQRINQAEDYNTQMADTVYQRGVQDMEAAGLNPILAAGSPDPMATAVMSAGIGPQTAGTANISSSQSSSASQSQQSETSADLAQSQMLAADSQTALNKAMAVKVLNDAANSASQHTAIGNELASSSPTAQIARAHPVLTGWLDWLTGRGLTTGSASQAADTISTVSNLGGD